MADFFRVQFGVVSRADGHCAAKRSAYQACSRAVDHEGRVFDFSRKQQEHVRTIMLLPEGSPDWTCEPGSLWQRAALAEKRIDAQEARIVDFSMPRQVPETLWEQCIRCVYSPFVERGMAFQIDIHDAPASDGGRNVNVHGLATLRPIHGLGFAKLKDRSWNDLFRERSGRAVREMFATRLTAFCQEHGLHYQGDARPNADRDLPDPEPQLPRWNFEAHVRTQEMPEALAALHEHRARRRVWEISKAEEIEAVLDLGRLEMRLRRQRQRRIIPADSDQRPTSTRDRRAAILRAWHNGGWIDVETIPAIDSVRFDQTRHLLWIDLADGSTLIDRGDAITLRGRVTWTAAMETAAAAKRHGWESVRVHGDQAYKDAVSMACLLSGIEVENHSLSPLAQAAFERLVASQADHSIKPNDPNLGAAEPNFIPTRPAASSRPSSRDIQLARRKRMFVPNLPAADLSNTAAPYPVFKPTFT